MPCNGRNQGNIQHVYTFNISVLPHAIVNWHKCGKPMFP
jgi:hypothetical protein